MAAGNPGKLKPETGWADLLAEGRFPRFALICLAIWLNAADSLVTATVMPSVGVEIGGYAYFGWATAGFLMGAIMAGASAGRVAEIIGLRLATTVAGFVLAVGCALSAAAPNIGMFLAGRLVQGIGSGWISGFAMVAITLFFPERHLARVFASISGVWGIATVLGPLVGGLFAQAGSWRSVFWLFALQALVYSAAAPLLLQRAAPSRPGRRGPRRVALPRWPGLDGGGGPGRPAAGPGGMSGHVRLVREAAGTPVGERALDLRFGAWDKATA